MKQSFAMHQSNDIQRTSDGGIELAHSQVVSNNLKNNRKMMTLSACSMVHKILFHGKNSHSPCITIYLIINLKPVSVVSPTVTEYI